ncbi:hypothetical protein VTI74DRAFT_10963 [Chaetomium olivicolor]
MNPAVSSGFWSCSFDSVVHIVPFTSLSSFLIHDPSSLPLSQGRPSCTAEISTDNSRPSKSTARRHLRDVEANPEALHRTSASDTSSLAIGYRTRLLARCNDQSSAGRPVFDLPMTLKTSRPAGRLKSRPSLDLRGPLRLSRNEWFGFTLPLEFLCRAAGL